MVPTLQKWTAPSVSTLYRQTGQFLTLYNIGRLERKLRRRERAAIGKPKLPTPLRPTSKSKRKIKAPSIDGSKEESEGSHVSDRRKKKGKKYRALPEIVKSYQAKNVQAPGGRITVRFNGCHHREISADLLRKARPVQRQGFLGHGKASLPIRLPSEKARMAPRKFTIQLVSEKFLAPSPTAQPFSEDRFLGSHGVSLDPMMGEDQEIWNQWRIRAPQPGPLPRSHPRGKQPQQQSEASWQLGSSQFQHSSIPASSFTSIMPSNHRHEAASASQFSNSRLPPPGHTNSPSWHTETTERPSYENQQPSSLDKKIIDIQSKDKVTSGQAIISIQSHPKLNPTSNVESEPAEFVGSVSNTWPIIKGPNDLACTAGAPWKENRPSFGRPIHAEDLSFGKTPIHSGDNGQAIGYFQRSQNNSLPASWSNRVAPDIERSHNPPQFQSSFTSISESMGEFMEVGRAPTENEFQSYSDTLKQHIELMKGQQNYQVQRPCDTTFHADGPSVLAMPQIPVLLPFQMPRYNQFHSSRQKDYPYQDDGDLDQGSLRPHLFSQQKINSEQIHAPFGAYQRRNQQILLSKCDNAYHSNQANITPLHELQPQAMSFYDPSEPMYQETMADDPRLFLAPFDGAFDSIEPQQHLRCLGSSTNIRSNRPLLVPPTVNDAVDLYGDPLNPVNDQHLSFDQFDQSHFVEQGMWQERPGGRVEEQVGMTEEDWHGLWGQRAYHR